MLAFKYLHHACSRGNLGAVHSLREGEEVSNGCNLIRVLGGTCAGPSFALGRELKLERYCEHGALITAVIILAGIGEDSPVAEVEAFVACGALDVARRPVNALGPVCGIAEEGTVGVAEQLLRGDAEGGVAMQETFNLRSCAREVEDADAVGAGLLNIETHCFVGGGSDMTCGVQFHYLACHLRV